MESRIATAHPTPELSSQDRSTLFHCGLWLRIGFISACGLAAVLLQLLNGEMKPLSALALATGAATLAVVSWWRARTVLDVVDEADVPTATESLPANTEMAGSVF
jgi:hypothetical protein